MSPISWRCQPMLTQLIHFPDGLSRLLSKRNQKCVVNIVGFAALVNVTVYEFQPLFPGRPIFAIVVEVCAVLT